MSIATTQSQSHGIYHSHTRMYQILTEETNLVLNSVMLAVAYVSPCLCLMRIGINKLVDAFRGVLPRAEYLRHPGAFAYGVRRGFGGNGAQLWSAIRYAGCRGTRKNVAHRFLRGESLVSFAGSVRGWTASYMVDAVWSGTIWRNHLLCVWGGGWA